MPPPLFSTVVHLLFAVILFLSAAATTSATNLGATYNPSIPNLPPPEHVVSALQSLHITSVRLLDPTPATVRSFAYTNISVLLSVPDYLLPSFASDRSAASLWLYNHVLPYYPRTRISLISAGSDAISAASSDPMFDTSTAILPAVRNLHLSLLDLGIRNIPVSTTFSFTDIMTTSFPPSSAEFQEPIGSLIIRPFLQFLEQTNSSFLINLYPYNVYKINSAIPVGFALFQEQPFNFRDDPITVVRYRNLFDMMADSVIAAMAVTGHENIPVIVTETGWPSEAEAQAAGNYAEMYLKGLVTHLRSGVGTPLRKEGVAEAYIYQLFDGGDWKQDSAVNGSSLSPLSHEKAGHSWGIMYPNMSMKYNVKFSGSTRVLGSGKRLMETVLLVLVSVVSVLRLLMIL